MRGYHSLTTFQTNSAILSGTGGSSTSNTTRFWTGTQSNKLTAGNASTVIFTQTLSPAINICSDSFFQVTFFIDNKANVMNNSRLDLYIGNDASNLWTYEFGSFAIRDSSLTYWGEWSQYSVIKRKMTVAGSPNCAAVSFVAIGLKAQATTQDTITFGEVGAYRAERTKGIVIFQEDDQWTSGMREGQRRLDSLGWRSTIAVNAGLLGQANKFSEVQMDSTYALGKIDVINHLWVHDSIINVSDDSAFQLVKRNYQALHAKHWKGYSLLAYPYGVKNRAKDSLIRASGMVDLARLTAGNNLGEAQHYADRYAVKVLTFLDSNLAEATVEAGLADVIASKTVGIIGYHKIALVPLDASTWPTARWLLLLAYVKGRVDAGELEVMSWTDYLNSVGLPNGGRRARSRSR